MACAGECKKQVYTFSARLTDVAKSNPSYVDLSLEEKNAFLELALSYLFPVVLSKNCQENGCDCIRIAGEAEIWSLPVKYMLPEVLRMQKEDCIYEFYGIYEVRSSLYTGLSMPQATGNTTDIPQHEQINVGKTPNLSVLKKTIY